MYNISLPTFQLKQVLICLKKYFCTLKVISSIWIHSCSLKIGVFLKESMIDSIQIERKIALAFTNFEFEHFSWKWKERSLTCKNLKQLIRKSKPAKFSSKNVQNI